MNACSQRWSPSRVCLPNAARATPSIGALAAGIWGRPRATSDVDFLIGREWLQGAGAHGSPRLSSDVVFVLSVVERETGVGVDAFVVAAPPKGARSSFPAAVERGLRRATLRDGIPIAAVEIVVATKLLRGELQDVADVVRVLRAGAVDRSKLRKFLAAHLEAPLVARYDELSRSARAESAAAKKTERIVRRPRR